MVSIPSKLFDKLFDAGLHDHITLSMKTYVLHVVIALEIITGSHIFILFLTTGLIFYHERVRIVSLCLWEREANVPHFQSWGGKLYFCHPTFFLEPENYQ